MKSNQMEMKDLPEAPHRGLLLSRIEVAEAIADKKTTLKIADEKILEAMKAAKSREWQVETEDGQRYIFKRKAGSEKISSKKVKEVRLESVEE